MLTAQQQVLVQAIEELNLAQVQRLLADGLDPNFMDAEKGPVISVWSDGLFQWWEKVCEAYEAGQPLTEQQKQQDLQVHLDILEALIQAKVNLHLWDAEEIYGPLWDAASAACVPAAAALASAVCIAWAFTNKKTAPTAVSIGMIISILSATNKAP